MTCVRLQWLSWSALPCLVPLGRWTRSLSQAPKSPRQGEEPQGSGPKLERWRFAASDRQTAVKHTSGAVTNSFNLELIYILTRGRGLRCQGGLRPLQFLDQQNQDLCQLFLKVSKDHVCISVTGRNERQGVRQGHKYTLSQ